MMFLYTLALAGSLISSLPLASPAVLDPGANCTASVMPPSVIHSTYTNVDVFYTTSVVTVYARESSSSPSPSITTFKQYMEDNDNQNQHLQARHDNLSTTSSTSLVGATDCAWTTTMATPTTTVTTTYTFSHAARATSTASACSPYNIYNGTVSYNSKQTKFHVGQPRGEVFPQHLTPQDCCNQCFDGSCMWYIFDNIDRDGRSWVGGCKVFWSDGGCVNGVGHTEALRMENRDGGRGLTGLGPCLVEVGYFSIG